MATESKTGVAPAASGATPLPISRVRRVVDIDAVDDVAGYIKVTGREVAVHHLDAEAYAILRQLQESPATVDVSNAYDIVARICPELSRDEIDRLSGPKIGAIIAVAEQGIRDVELQAPNAEGPATTETSTMSESPPA